MVPKKGASQGCGQASQNCRTWQTGDKQSPIISPTTKSSRKKQEKLDTILQHATIQGKHIYNLIIQRLSHETLHALSYPISLLAITLNVAQAPSIRGTLAFRNGQKGQLQGTAKQINARLPWQQNKRPNLIGQRQWNLHCWMKYKWHRIVIQNKSWNQWSRYKI